MHNPTSELSKDTCVLFSSVGPRWASWNLGVFMCIRCAGIHRNLGVHVSRVKSVNLDSWTPEQIEVSSDVCVFSDCKHYLVSCPISTDL